MSISPSSRSAGKVIRPVRFSAGRANSAAASHPVDRHVGSRVAHRRAELGLTQGEVAKSLGLSFQQLQKYEKGVNRISASKLWELTDILRVETAYFFAGLPKRGGTLEVAQDSPVTRYTVEISLLSTRLPTSRQKLVLDFIKAFLGLPSA